MLKACKSHCIHSGAHEDITNGLNREGPGDENQGRKGYDDVFATANFKLYMSRIDAVGWDIREGGNQ
jgi:hypothetical protein